MQQNLSFVRQHKVFFSKSDHKDLTVSLRDLPDKYSEQFRNFSLTMPSESVLLQEKQSTKKGATENKHGKNEHIS